ncbi:BA75_01750T0 [Komagataella pastoris]|uniref:BA75_01750T0 n=1 Tax=Komagataella pastoris TaxID=4922 RepID=A0A1B2J828_PICPA|nr:BA75_01750T0 [Komagataella pastoris]
MVERPKIKFNIKTRKSVEPDKRDKSPSRNDVDYRERQAPPNPDEEDTEIDAPRGRPSEKTKDDQESEVEIDEAMMKVMGFGGFGTTKLKKVGGTDVSGAKTFKPSEYRQYVNRTKGFNRPLSPTRKGKK